MKSKNKIKAKNKTKKIETKLNTYSNLKINSIIESAATSASSKSLRRRLTCFSYGVMMPMDSGLILSPDSVTTISSSEQYFRPVSQNLLPVAQCGIKSSGISPFLSSFPPLSIKRVVITLAELLESVRTSRRAPDTNLKIFKLLSTSVTVFPVRGGPKITR
ncbi:hypothetical protein GQX74_012072 [Glossina fuscipes]|nr:hypothetical protein GQX74_012072 [Glossina fuscipes]